MTMNYNSLVPVTGMIQNVSQTPGDCCNQQMSLLTPDGPVNFTISSNTVVIDNMRLRPGMLVTAFYDASRPVILIYPPQYQAELIAVPRRDEMVALNFFDRNLTAADRSLRLNVSRTTDVTTLNGQRFTCSPRENFLLVYYSVTTRSIPPQTTPRRVIVLCR